MKYESLCQLVELCRNGKCAIKFEACQSGIVAQVVAYRGDVRLETSTFLDPDDKGAAEKLQSAIDLLQ